MFPRITKSTKNRRTYEYLVISESVHVKGKGSTTRNIANLGNVSRFNCQDISNLIDGLIKIFKLEGSITGLLMISGDVSDKQSMHDKKMLDI